VRSLSFWISLLVFIMASGWLIYRYESKLTIDEFLARHWAYPILPQGEPPEQFTALEASLDPKSCGECHTSQYQQWRDSLHSHAMGPGILWQLNLGGQKEAMACLRCHAPMTEQLALLSQQQGWSNSKAAPPEYIPPDLHRNALVCAACHVRAHVRYGPPTLKAINPSEGPHAGFVESAAFEDSRFCATCHQFPEDGPRLNGKLREDSYNQWLASSFAKKGQSCQSCHMPDRKHLWKGIHDEQMTRSALTVSLNAKADDKNGLVISADVENTGAGHSFPTYLVPEVLLNLELVDGDGKVTSLDSYTIAWRADISLNKELFDHRLAPGEKVKLQGTIKQVNSFTRYRLRIAVAPRQHYVRMFEAYLQANEQKLNAETSNLIRTAIIEAKAANYEFIAAENSL
jgi:hypothetical protein